MSTYDPVLTAEGAALVRAFFAECSICVWEVKTVGKFTYSPRFNFRTGPLSTSQLAQRIAESEHARSPGRHAG